VQFKLHASVLRYPWAEDDSAFASSSDVLRAVYDLCRYTTKATSLDTYTDSNTRERLPCELTVELC
jgi:alpha-L-rhamnosidase